VEQGPAQAAPVRQELLVAAAALPFRHAVEPAGAWVAGRDQLERCGPRVHGPVPFDGDAAVLQRLPEQFQKLPREFARFIQEEDAVVRERQFARTAAPEKAAPAGAVMRRPERAPPD